jgi:hypothetical protein
MCHAREVTQWILTVKKTARRGSKTRQGGCNDFKGLIQVHGVVCRKSKFFLENFGDGQTQGPCGCPFKRPDFEIVIGIRKRPPKPKPTHNRNGEDQINPAAIPRG